MITSNRAGLIGWVCFLVPAVALALHSVPADDVVLVALKTVTAALTIGLIPGVATVLLLRSLEGQGVLDLVGIGIAVSEGLVEVATMVSVLLHVHAAPVALGSAVLAMTLGATLVSRRTSWSLNLHWQPLEKIVCLMIAGLAIVMYVKGSPVYEYEDQLHAGIVRRLALAEHPRLDNVYSVPGIVYSYPLPGTHFYMAMVSRLGGIDPAFAYHKMRFFWTIAALLFLHIAAKRIFPPPIPGVVSVSAALFVFGGALADVPGMYWAQLVPYSHPSDVAMNVLLPGLLAVTLWFLGAEGRRETAFFFGLALGLGGTLAAVHIREIPQFFVYGASFAAAIVFLRGEI